MPNRLLFLLLCLFPALMVAQTLTISDEITLRSDTDYHLVGKSGGKVILLQDRNTKHLVTAFDRRMQESWEKELELKGRNIRIIEVLDHPRGFQILYLYREKGDNYLRLDSFDPAANVRDSVTLTTFTYWLNNPTFEVVRSQDQSKVLLLLGNSPQKMNTLSIDLDSSRLLYEVEVAPENFFFNQDFLQAEVNDDGDGFIIVDRDNFQSRRKEHHYEVHYLSVEDRQLSQFDITLGDSLTYDVYFRYDNLNDRLVAGGLYSDKDLLRADGYFFLATKPDDGRIVNLKFHHFTNSLVENVEGKKLKGKKNRGLEEISVKDAILRQDGGLLLITERNRQLERRATAVQSQVLNSYSGRPLVDSYYDEIVAFSIHPNGEEHWNNILHKKQYSQDDGGAFSSFMLLESPRKLRFLFNDEIRFENTVSEYVLDGRGSLDRNSLFSTRDLDLKLRFRDGVQVAANEVIIPSELRNRLRLVTMTY